MSMFYKCTVLILVYEFECGGTQYRTIGLEVQIYITSDCSFLADNLVTLLLLLLNVLFVEAVVVVVVGAAAMVGGS